MLTNTGCKLTWSFREDWQIGPETSERAANVLKVLYKSEKGGHVKTLESHRDIREYPQHEGPSVTTGC